MESIGKITEDIINRSPFLRESMTEGLVNISALARKIQPEIEAISGRDVKEGAIVMAIKRMSPGLYHKLNVKIKNVLGELGDFLVRSNLSDYTYQNSDTLIVKQSDFLRLADNDSDGFFALCKGVSETTIITTDKNKDLIERIFQTEKLIASTQNLASISVKLPKINTEIYGIYYYILKQLAWEGINIIEVISTANEFTIIIDQEDVDRSFKILMQLKRGF
ncbi:MAG TPA: hypothetical protein VKZ44_07450 [Taishania sp.]|nr:hypothetical protein [Taishania sp.]